MTNKQCKTMSLVLRTKGACTLKQYYIPGLQHANDMTNVIPSSNWLKQVFCTAQPNFCNPNFELQHSGVCCPVHRYMKKNTDAKMATPLDFCKGMSQPVNWNVTKTSDKCEHVSRPCEVIFALDLSFHLVTVALAICFALGIGFWWIFGELGFGMATLETTVFDCNC